MSKDTNSTYFLQPKELQNIFGIAKSTQAKYRREKSIPYYKINGKVYYKKSEIDAWIETGKVV